MSAQSSVFMHAHVYHVSAQCLYSIWQATTRSTVYTLIHHLKAKYVSESYLHCMCIFWMIEINLFSVFAPVVIWKIIGFASGI